MSLKNLHAFQPFDLSAFLQGKQLVVTHCRPWQDFDTKEERGTAVELAITKDETKYPPAKDGTVYTNLYEKIVVKVPKGINIPTGAIVTVVNGSATVYGDYRNQLSIRAEDVKVVQPPAPPTTTSGK